MLGTRWQPLLVRKDEDFLNHEAVLDFVLGWSLRLRLKAPAGRIDAAGVTQRRLVRLRHGG